MPLAAIAVFPDQNERPHRTFEAAVESGRLTARPGLVPRPAHRAPWASAAAGSPEGISPKLLERLFGGQARPRIANRARL